MKKLEKMPGLWTFDCFAASPDPDQPHWIRVWDSLRKNFSPGDRIPCEQDLAKDLDIGRPKLREALYLLQQLGAVERRTRSGTHLREKPDPAAIASAFVLLSSEIASETTAPACEKGRDWIREVRVGVEGAAASLGAKFRTEEDLHAIEQSIHDQVDTIGTIRDWVMCDQRFHQRVLQAAHNEVLDILGGIIIAGFAAKHPPHQVCEPPVAWRIIQDHIAILEAIDCQKDQRAQQLVVAHLSNIDESSRRKPLPLLENASRRLLSQLREEFSRRPSTTSSLHRITASRRSLS
ncbi:MAG: FadR family transcriptional regulator [Planctomycetota bacterium]|nr:MAG: FadR family transcriptional regulator [Planctomycetota bacterium]REK21686.1 MAG: FadR family transcriptional regulator [Planctomycetota bacterium]REK32752.1 MAG: FadR family transcriptional regulator [Planctomycetota bacterium]